MNSMSRAFQTIEYYYSKVIKKLRRSALKDSHIHRTSKVESGSNLVNVKMDKYSFCGYDCDINNATIGSFTSIGNNVVIGGGMHPISWVSTSPVFYEGRDSVTKKFAEYERDLPLETKIGSDVWVGQNVMIKQGVTIGHGSVIGMGSIVTKDVLPYTIIAGNPAKLIRERFPTEISGELVDSKWWELDENVLKGCASHIRDPKKFLKYLREKSTSNI